MTVAVLTWAIKRVEAGERVAIASVVRASGSVPGKPGARLAISSSGEKRHLPSTVYAEVE